MEPEKRLNGAEEALFDFQPGPLEGWL
ncbi:hypothetical protein BD01_0492 [Thermococcus nautili]|uniref:Uncharacterized protein n=1 Tax=Thermococcus nautili TaxID=195522 RepID=W8NSM0_9EURY|nr:hypothetical protein BD01_0492 [Thermococcus nautili]